MCHLGFHLADGVDQHRSDLYHSLEARKSRLMDDWLSGRVGRRTRLDEAALRSNVRILAQQHVALLQVPHARRRCAATAAVGVICAAALLQPGSLPWAFPAGATEGMHFCPLDSR